MLLTTELHAKVVYDRHWLSDTSIDRNAGKKAAKWKIWTRHVLHFDMLQHSRIF